MHSLLNRCTRLFAAATSVAVMGSALMVAPGAAAGGVSASTILTGYSRPVLVTAPRGSSRKFFIVEQTGKIKIATYDSDRGWRKIGTFLDIRSKVAKGGEQGLLGLAFHPDYASNHLFYINYTRKSDGATVVAESRRLSSNSNKACVSCLRQVIRISQPYSNHNGGMIAFGPDEMLYIGMGDGGSADDPAERAQNLESRLGKMLRIDPRNPAGSATYSVPSDNPDWGDPDAKPEIWSIGWRNPWRFSFDRETGDLWAGDVGQSKREEIDKSEAGSGLDAGKGDNFGWDFCEGTHNQEGGKTCATFGVQPVREYSHTAGRCSVTGGYVYRGPEKPAWHGRYVYSDYCSGRIWVINGSGSFVGPSAGVSTGRNISGFGEDGAGRLFATDIGGRILRLRFTGSP